MVSREQLVFEAKEENYVNCIVAEIFPIELSSRVRSNSILWLPIIPTPWTESKVVDKVSLEVAYYPVDLNCNASEVTILSEGITLTPSRAFSSKYQREQGYCVYEFNVSGAEISRENSFLQFNKHGLCPVARKALKFRSKTAYENHFQPW